MDHKKILCVEDDADVARVLNTLLTPLQAEILQAETGLKAVAMAATHRPHLILTEVRLPDLPVAALVRSLKALPPLAAVPCVVLTADVASDDVRQAMREGAAEALLKTEFLTGKGVDRIGRLLQAPSPEASPASPSGKRARVLVVDDDEDVQKLLGAVLGAMDVEVRRAMDGLEGVVATLTELPDLVLLDLNLPRLNGLDVLRAIHAVATSAAIPVIILTGNATPSSVKEALGLGAVDFLIKSQILQGATDRLRKAVETASARRRVPAKAP